MKVSEINAALDAAQQKEADAGSIRRRRPESGSGASDPERAKVPADKVMPYPGTNQTPESLRLQYEYELERSREISNSVSRLMTLIPWMMAGVFLLFGVTVTFCTENISEKIFLILSAADAIVLLCALVVTSTVHFYILNPAPAQEGETDWLLRMKRDLQRGNNWRAWLVFTATLMIYGAAGVALAIIILGLIGM